MSFVWNNFLGIVVYITIDLGCSSYRYLTYLFINSHTVPLVVPCLLGICFCMFNSTYIQNFCLGYSFQDTQTISNALLSATELPREDPNVLPPCKTERMDDYPMTCVVNREERLDDYPSPLADDPQPLLSLFNQQPGILRQYKRRRHNESNSNRSNASEISSRLTHDPCSSTTTTASTEASVTATTKRNFLSALVEFQLLESLEPKDKTPVAPPEFNAALHNSSVPPSCLKFIESLQNEIHKISIEKETLKFEMLSAQAVINILQSRIDLLNKENEDLKRNAQEAE